METVKPSEVITPRKSRLGRAFAKVLHIRAATGISPHDELIKKTKAGDDDKIISFFDDQDDQEKRNRAVEEAFLAKIFASVSTVKAAYAYLQFAQSPYDADGIQSSDQMIVSELKKVSELKYCYLNKMLKDFSPGRTLVLAEIQEQKSLLRTYEITSKKLDYQLKLKDSEITFLKEKLEEAESDNKLLEKRLISSGQLSVSAEITKLSSLRPSHFTAYYRQAVKSIRSFVNLLIKEMEISGWDLDVAARSIEPGISFWKSIHKCFAFESYVCREMFDGFNHPNFSIQTQPDNKRVGSHRYFDQFLELRSVKAADYLAWKPKSLLASFCRAKYLKLVHTKMEEGLFGNLDHRDLVESGGALPETPFFLAFIEMAKRVWLLHCLSLSFDPQVSIFQVGKGTRFSEVYMESLSDEAFDSKPETDPARVAFVVVPGFRIGKTVLQCQVYLC